MGTPELRPPRTLGEHPVYHVIWDVIQPKMRDIDVETGNPAISSNGIPLFSNSPQDAWLTRDGAIFVTGSFTGSKELTKQVDPDWLEHWFDSYRPQCNVIAQVICAVALAIRARRKKHQEAVIALDKTLLEFLRSVGKVTGQLFEEMATAQN